MATIARKWITNIFVFTCIFFGCHSLSAAEGDQPIVLVSVSPYKFLVERIAGDTVRVINLVPPTANVHTYEPTIKEVLAAGKATAWFRIGETFEPRVIKALSAHNPKLTLVDLREGLTLIAGDSHCCCCHHEGMDLHIWLSTGMMKQQAQTIARALIQLFPQHAEQYKKGLQEHLKELDALTLELNKLLNPVRGKTVLVTHPAYGYLCRDYGIIQLPVEVEGKDPSPRQLTALLNQARQLKVRTIYTQSQYPDKVANLLAGQLNAKLVKLDPYAENYVENLRTIAKHFSQP